MKAAFTTSGSDLNAPLDDRFGRAPKFLMVDLETESFEIVDNKQNLNAAQGAGIQSAQILARSGASCVVTGHCGPKAFRTLTAAGIKIFNSKAATVGEALALLKSGQLAEAKTADVESHWV
ncbi:MAG: Dinitrogenase iron-molybdenum cofactor [candidate division BRC1 bacterium ADurb.BinA364]|nr:MAG: Dinitrogenase iron-molybdenum cofactor [candidate division BRC1 bacterium ADurb.BinA364]